MSDGNPRQIAPRRRIARRALLRAAVGVGITLCAPRHATAQVRDPRSQPPEAGDQFVFVTGERKGQVVTLSDLPVDAPPVLVYPVDPKSRVVRDGSRLNQVLLVRLDPGELDEDTRVRSASGIVAYSGVCTHAGCDVALWQADTRRFRCPCHESEFDPRGRGRVVGGPAPRRLPQLPLKVVEEVIVADGHFTSRPGFQPG
jgi:rieske iron-sulfur protein